MITSGMNANMKNADSVMHDGHVLEYSRIKNMTIQAWSPFQHGFFKGSFIDNEDFPNLNAKLAEVGEKYGLSKTGVAAAWILRHPANIQLIAGTMTPDAWMRSAKLRTSPLHVPNGTISTALPDIVCRNDKVCEKLMLMIEGRLS
jgi:predicted oxidoreductase